MALNLTALSVSIVVNIIIIAPSLWMAGKSIVGEKKAKFTDALWIVALGVVIGNVLGTFVGSGVGIIQLIVWLYLVRTYFDTGWLNAFIISCVAIVIFMVTIFVLGIFGFTLFSIF